MKIYTYTMIHEEYPVTAEKVMAVLDEQIGIYQYEWLPNLLTTQTFRRILAAVLCEQVSECGKELSPEFIQEQALVTADNIVRAAGYRPVGMCHSKKEAVIRSYLYGVTDQYNSVDIM